MKNISLRQRPSQNVMPLTRTWNAKTYGALRSSPYALIEGHGPSVEGNRRADEMLASKKV